MRSPRNRLATALTAAVWLLTSAAAALALIPPAIEAPASLTGPETRVWDFDFVDVEQRQCSQQVNHEPPSVTQEHTYFVGQQGVWVHNDCDREVLEELVDENGIDLLFGQPRISRSFRENSDAPDTIRGRTINDVAADITKGDIPVDDFVLQAFREGENLVTINNRGLAALSIAEKKPVFVQVVKPTKAELNRLGSQPLREDLALPGPKIPITPGRNNLEIEDIVSLPGTD